MNGSLNDLEQMKNIDLRTVDPNTLVDINDVEINPKLPVEEKMTEYLRQIKNPYCYKCGDYVIKVGFTDTERTIEDCFEDYLSTLE